MKKKKVSISLDIHNPTEAMVYEYLEMQGRKKTKLIIELVRKKIEEENKFMYHEQAVAEALMQNTFFMSSLSEIFIDTVMEKLKGEEVSVLVEKLKEHESNKKEPEETYEEKKEEMLDLSLIEKGLAMFEQI